MIAPDILACFVNARRVHFGLSEAGLAEITGVPERQIRSCERQGFLSAVSRTRLVRWCKLEESDDLS